MIAFTLLFLSWAIAATAFYVAALRQRVRAEEAMRDIVRNWNTEVENIHAEWLEIYERREAQISLKNQRN